MTDNDFIVTAYDRSVPVALVEFKHEKAAEFDSSHPTYRTLIELGNRAKIPFFVCRYAENYLTYAVTAMNWRAEQIISGTVEMTEKRWAQLLYRDIRGRELPDNLRFREDGVLIPDGEHDHSLCFNNPCKVRQNDMVNALSFLGSEDRIESVVATLRKMDSRELHEVSRRFKNP